jgi:hypothetical protein
MLEAGGLGAEDHALTVLGYPPATNVWFDGG